MKKELTYKEVLILNNVISGYFVTNGFWDVEKRAFSDKKDTKLTANMKNVKKQAEKIEVAYNELVDDLRLDNCAVDEKTKVILMDANGAKQFTVEGTKNFNKGIKALLDQKVDIHVRITEGDWDLSENEKEVFNGVLIPAFEVSTEEVETELAPERKLEVSK
jgi:hypothetical protein